MALAEGLLLDADISDRLRHLAGLAAGDGARHDAPPFIPGDARDATRPDDRTALLDQINDQPLHQQREATPRLRPGHRHLPHAVRRAVDARHPGVQERLELAGIEMPPHPLLRVVVTRQRLRALRARPPGGVAMLRPQVDPLFARVQRHAVDRPGRLDAENGFEELRVLHQQPPGRRWLRADGTSRLLGVARSPPVHPRRTRKDHVAYRRPSAGHRTPRR